MYAFDMIETREFIPTPEYLAHNMAAPAVVRFLKKSRFRKHLYMITGLKVVRGAQVKSAASRALGVDFKVGVDMSGTGVPVNLGPEIATERKYRVRGSFESSSDFIFAFRLRRIAVHRSGEITHADYTKGAMYDADVSGNTDSCLPFEVSGLASEDAGAEEFGMSFTKEIVDGDMECICVSASSAF